MHKGTLCPRAIGMSLGLLTDRSKTTEPPTRLTPWVSVVRNGSNDLPSVGIPPIIAPVVARFEITGMYRVDRDRVRQPENARMPHQSLGNAVPYAPVRLAAVDVASICH